MESKSGNKSVKTKRVYAEDVEIDHDLFKLEMAYYQRNISHIPTQPEFKAIEHCHFFHSYDSSGRKMTECEATGGHKHEVKVTTDENGNLKATCGAAKGGWETDKHTHEITYIRSERVKPRKLNDNAIKAFAAYDTEPKG